MEVPVIRDFREIPEGVDTGLLLECEFGMAKWAVYTTAVEYGVFDRLSSPSTAGELAERAGFHPTVTKHLLDALVGLGLLVKEGGRYRNSTLAERVLARYGFVFSSAKRHPFWGRLGRMLVEGKIEPLGGEGEPPFGDFELQRHYALRALAGEFQATLKLMEAEGIFSMTRRFIDVGGGHGIYAIGFIKTHPGLKGAILDRPEVLPTARRFVEAYGLEEKIELIAGDIFRDRVPGSYELAFISDIGLPYVPPDAIEAAFGELHRVLEPPGVLVVKEIAPHRDWAESFYQLAHQLLALVQSGDPEWLASMPTAEDFMGIMRRVGFPRTKFLGWIGRWETVVMGWKTGKEDLTRATKET